MRDRLSRWRDSYEDVQVKADSDAEFGYLAGILDGEGCFKTASNTNTFGLQVAVIDECLIDWLAEHFAGCRHEAGKTVAGNQIYRWTLQRHADLAYVLPRLAPFLVIKRVQATAMLRLVRHLQSRPRWNVPTSRAPKAERPERREMVEAWRTQIEPLRLAVREARQAL